MIEEFRHIDDSVTRLPRVPVDLSARLRDLRARQGLKQSEVARRMRLDPSIPSLWEQGKRPVPANRVAALADALGVSLDELLEEGSAESPAQAPVEPVEAVRPTAPQLGPNPLDVQALRPVPRVERLDPHLPLVTLVRSSEPEPLDMALVEPAPPRVFVPAERPPLQGEIPAGWEPSDRAPDITPSLPDGYWLDVVRLEKRWAKDLLRARLCPEDRAAIEGNDVPGAVLAERLYQHCVQQEGFLSSRLPLIELIFRVVLRAEYGGLTVDALLEALRERTGAVTVSAQLLRRLKDSVRVYPITWVDRDRFR